MNEKLKELIAQVGGIGYDDDGNELTPALVGKSLEKFAELIVRECMKVCKKTEQYEVGNQDPDEVGCIRAGAVFCREDIKEHFGVE